MGQSAATVRAAAENSADAAKKDAVARIKMLEELGNSLIDKFQNGLRGDEDREKFKIGKFLTEYSAINLVEKNDTKKLKDYVSGIVNDVVKGDIAGVITTVVDFGIDAMLASSSGSVAEKQLYTAKLDGFGLQRLDVYMYQYTLEASGLVEECDRLFVYCYTISTIGEEITGDMLRSLIALNVPNVDSNNKPLPMDQLIANQMAVFDILKPALLHIPSSGKPGGGDKPAEEYDEEEEEEPYYQKIKAVPKRAEPYSQQRGKIQAIQGKRSEPQRGSKRKILF